MASSSRQKVVLVTGGSRGIGLACVSILLKTFNAKVVSVSRSVTDELTALESTGNLTIITGDVSASETSDKAVAACKALGGLDALCLNAGILNSGGSVATNSIPEWKNMFDINFFSLITTIQASIELLREKKSDSDVTGRIIMVSSGAATGNTAGWGAYNTSKAAMNSLGRTLGSEEKTISTVCIRPGTVDTAMQKQIRDDSKPHLSEKDYTKFVNLHANKELLHPDLPGFVLAALCIDGPMELSGQFLNWNADELSAFQKK